MKRKYYLRGLGFGILITTAVFALNGKKEMTDEDVIRRAEALGYVKQEVPATPGIDLGALKDQLTPKPTKEPTPTDVPEPTPTKEPTPTAAPTPSPVPTVEPIPTVTPEPTAAPEPTVTPEPTKAPEENIVKAKITVERGMTSKQVCQLIAKAGIVKDWTELNSYIIGRGLADYINIGTFSLSSDMSHKEIAKIITGR